MPLPASPAVAPLTASRTTTAERAAAARRRRRAEAPGGARSRVKDPCPSCGLELSRPYGGSARVALFSADRGRFHWQCPHCRSTWAERASAQVGSTTRSS